jgi:predicted dehydrogenase
MSDETSSLAGTPLRVGLIGCGLIAQVMHLPYLGELGDRYEVRALCDVSTDVLEACAARYGVERTFTDWRDLLGEELDAVLVLTSSDHAEIGVEAARGGKHVFVEKPMALTPAGAERMAEAAEQAGVRLMVGYMKRYDPAVERAHELLAGMDDLRFVRVTTLESPLGPYVAHYPLTLSASAGPPPADPYGELSGDELEVVQAALADGDAGTAAWYRWILLDCLVHEFNLLRGLVGEPSRLNRAGLSSESVRIDMDFGEVGCQLAWLDLPGIARYSQEFCFYSPTSRLTIAFPSPFLRSMPTTLVVEGGDPGTTHSWETREVVGYEEAFKRELVEFHECVTLGRDPHTPGHDGLRDLVLARSVAAAHATGQPVDRPCEPRGAAVEDTVSS